MILCCEFQNGLTGISIFIPTGILSFIISVLDMQLSIRMIGIPLTSLTPPQFACLKTGT
jgi:hypothetical protein